MNDIRSLDYDVVIIGAGGAGLRAAIEASATLAFWALVCKSLLGKAHTVMAEGGAAAALGNVMSEDNWRVHFRDTMRGGKMHNDWRMAQIHAQEAPDRINELEAWGALFDRTPDGRINQRPFGGHTYSRLAHVGDRTGLEMIRVLQDKGVHSGIDVHMECTIVKLFVVGGKIAGALGYFRETGRFVLFKTGAIVIATGGIGKAWQITSNSWEYTGDGHAVAYEAGGGPHVDELGAGLIRQRVPVPRVLPGIARDLPRLADATCGDHDRARFEHHEAAGLAEVSERAGDLPADDKQLDDRAFHVHVDDGRSEEHTSE